MTEIVFWQSMITPHQAGLARALAARRGLTVHYIAAEKVERSRAAMGWHEPSLGNAEFRLAETKDEITQIAESFGPNAVHLCQGLRGNGVIAHALPALARKGARLGAMMEAVDRRGTTGWFKKPLYKRHVQRYGASMEFCLAIGHEAEQFIADCGFRADRIYPFSYFLSPTTRCADLSAPTRRLVYVGKLIELKRIDLLIEAFGAVNQPGTTLSIVGAGPLEQKLRALAAGQPNADAIEWVGTLANADAQKMTAASDGLILPSEYDGWGAVVTEALLAGTPAICSSACGAAVAVENSGVGGVFASGDKASLVRQLRAHLSEEPWPPAQRAALRTWAQNALSAEAGATYLEAILTSIGRKTQRPEAPWATRHTLENPEKIKTFVTR